MSEQKELANDSPSMTPMKPVMRGLVTRIQPLPLPLTPARREEQFAATPPLPDPGTLVFSSSHELRVHEAVAVPRNNGSLVLARVLEVGVAGLPLVRVGSLAQGGFKKAVPAVLCGRITCKPSLEHGLADNEYQWKKSNMTQSLLNIVDWLVDKPPGASQKKSANQLNCLARVIIKLLVDALSSLETTPNTIPTEALADYCRAQVVLALQLAATAGGKQ